MTDLLRSEIVAVYVIFGSETEARLIAREMVERRLAACVNILGGCHSIYRWDGAVEESDEVAAIFKTRYDAREVLMREIHRLHSYEVPAMAVLPIAWSHRDYVDWVIDNADAEVI